VEDFFGHCVQIYKQACSDLSPHEADSALIGFGRQNRCRRPAKDPIFQLSLASRDSMDNRGDQMAMTLPPMAARRQPP